MLTVYFCARGSKETFPLNSLQTGTDLPPPPFFIWRCGCLVGGLGSLFCSLSCFLSLGFCLASLCICELLSLICCILLNLSVKVESSGLLGISETSAGYGNLCIYSSVLGSLNRDCINSASDFSAEFGKVKDGDGCVLYKILYFYGLLRAFLLYAILGALAFNGCVRNYISVSTQALLQKEGQFDYDSTARLPPYSREEYQLQLELPEPLCGLRVRYLG